MKYTKADAWALALLAAAAVALVLWWTGDPSLREVAKAVGGWVVAMVAALVTVIGIVRLKQKLDRKA